MSTFTLAYDLLNGLIWLPTGSRRLRKQFVDAVGLPSGARVLELGCGTGQVTAVLVARGADIVAVDRSGAMLDRARRRAPHARYVKGNVIDVDVEGQFDVVVLAFVLHELEDEAARAKALSSASEQLGPGGRVAVLDWSLPADGWRRGAWRRVVEMIEPNGATDVLAGCLPAEIDKAGLEVTDVNPLAHGRASMLLAARR